MKSLQPKHGAAVYLFAASGLASGLLAFATIVIADTPDRASPLSALPEIDAYPHVARDWP